MYKRNIILFLLLLPAIHSLAQKQALTITPQYPERGQTVTITYHPDSADVAIEASSEKVQLIFNYSDMYGISNRIDMQRRANEWVTSLTIPSYGTFATFYLQAGDSMIRPAPDKMYELAVYRNRQPVENGYLYKAYSLPVQMGKTPGLAAKQAALYKEELKHFPANYEAKIRLLKYHLTLAKTDAEKQALLTRAHEVIRKKFITDPGNMGVLNRVTMAYLILGEESRLDSIRSVVVKRYPHSPAGIELRSDIISREPDSLKKLALLKDILKERTNANAEAFSDIYEQLFNYYISRGETATALFYARKMIGKRNPYTPLTYKSIAQAFLDHGLALDSARAYAEKALSLAGEFPVGVIRYFPETGYILPYVTDSAWTVSTNKATGNMLAILALIDLKQEKYAAAEQKIAKALAASKDEETLTNAATLYQATGKPARAFDAYWDLMTTRPSDDRSLAELKKYYVSWKGSEEGFSEKLEQLDAIWTQRMTVQLEKVRMNKKLPPVDSLVDMDGKHVPVEQLQNKIVVIDFWATWCVPCMQEMPYMQKVFNKYGQNPRVTFLIVNSGARNTLADAQGWFGRKKYDFPVYFNQDEQIGEKLGFNLIPATYILDEKGFTQFKFVGFEGAVYEKKLDAAISLLLNGNTASAPSENK